MQWDDNRYWAANTLFNSSVILCFRAGIIDVPSSVCQWGMNCTFEMIVSAAIKLSLLRVLFRAVKTLFNVQKLRGISGNAYYS